MSSLTFSYNIEETTNIIAQSTTSTEFLRVPPKETRGRDLERELRRSTNLELHCATLTEYLKVERIPRGLRVPLRPTLFSDSPDFCSRFERILNKCSFDLMTFTLEHLHRGIAQSKERITNIEQQLASSSTPEELQDLKTRINTTIEQHRRDTEARKRSKFIRDADDYEQNKVYKWRDNSISGTFSTRSNYRSTTDISTSGSDQERRERPSTSRFLGRGRRQPRRRGPVEERDGQRNTDFTRITRSQNRLY
ncbi:uncharacterized protein LOC143785106 [Ranitomeya variabilis]|uniref:uncharacterized protein LOC143785106 n=1 Tax=Ranitomeya variabilis TaxID=490064 RepID=UPI00405751D4